MLLYTVIQSDRNTQSNSKQYTCGRMDSNSRPQICKTDLQNNVGVARVELSELLFLQRNNLQFLQWNRRLHVSSAIPTVYTSAVMHASYTAGITTRAHTSILHMRIPGLLPTPAKAWSTIFPLAAKFLQFMVEQNAVSVLRRFSLEDLLSQGHATYQDTARILLGMYNSGEERRFSSIAAGEGESKRGRSEDGRPIYCCSHAIWLVRILTGEYYVTGGQFAHAYITVFKPAQTLWDYVHISVCLSRVSSASAGRAGFLCLRECLVCCCWERR